MHLLHVHQEISKGGPKQAVRKVKGSGFPWPFFLGSSEPRLKGSGADEIDGSDDVVGQHARAFHGLIEA
jgi:hypothetical protein